MNRYSATATAAALAILLSSCSSSKKDDKKSVPSSPGVTTSAGAPSSSPTSESGTTSAGTTAPASGGIVIQGFAFSGTLTVKAGEKVTVTNKDSAAHTLTDKAGKFDTGNIDGGGTGTFTAPTAPGSYQIICSNHPQMLGTLVVKA